MKTRFPSRSLFPFSFEGLPVLKHKIEGKRKVPLLLRRGGTKKSPQGDLWFLDEVPKA